MEVIDSQARDGVHDVETRLTQVEMVLWGINKDNGLKSEVSSLSRKIYELLERLNHYRDYERQNTCHGLKEFAKRDEFAAEVQEEVTEVKTAEINAGATRDVGKWKAWTDLAAQILTVAGIIFVAVFK